jgi:hypothetical protein
MALDLDTFDYHAPDAEALQKITNMREGAKAFAQVIVDNTPPSADQTLAVQHVVDALARGNRAVVLDGRPAITRG